MQSNRIDRIKKAVKTARENYLNFKCLQEFESSEFPPIVTQDNCSEITDQTLYSVIADVVKYLIKIKTSNFIEIRDELPLRSICYDLSKELFWLNGTKQTLKKVPEELLSKQQKKDFIYSFPLIHPTRTDQTTCFFFNNSTPKEIFPKSLRELSIVELLKLRRTNKYIRDLVDHFIFSREEKKYWEIQKELMKSWLGPHRKTFMQRVEENSVSWLSLFETLHARHLNPLDTGNTLREKIFIIAKNLYDKIIEEIYEKVPPSSSNIPDGLQSLQNKIKEALEEKELMIKPERDALEKLLEIGAAGKYKPNTSYYAKDDNGCMLTESSISWNDLEEEPEISSKKITEPEKTLLPHLNLTALKKRLKAILRLMQPQMDIEHGIACLQMKALCSKNEAFNDKLVKLENDRTSYCIRKIIVFIYQFLNNSHEEAKQSKLLSKLQTEINRLENKAEISSTQYNLPNIIIPPKLIYTLYNTDSLYNNSHSNKLKFFSFIHQYLAILIKNLPMTQYYDFIIKVDLFKLISGLSRHGIIENINHSKYLQDGRDILITLISGLPYQSYVKCVQAHLINALKKQENIEEIIRILELWRDITPTLAKKSNALPIKIKQHLLEIKKTIIDQRITNKAVVSFTFRVNERYKIQRADKKSTITHYLNLLFDEIIIQLYSTTEFSNIQQNADNAKELLSNAHSEVLRQRDFNSIGLYF